MTILHDAAGPAVLAVNVLSPSPPPPARPRMTVYIRARCGGQPKGARCLP